MVRRRLLKRRIQAVDDKSTLMHPLFHAPALRFPDSKEIPVALRRRERAREVVSMKFRCRAESVW